jgi:hypothetical protein
VVSLEAGRILTELRRDGRQPLVEDRDRLRVVGSGDDVFALGVEPDIAESGLRLPNTIACTVTAVQRSSGIRSRWR